MRITYLLSLSIKNLFAHKLRTFLTAGGVAISVGFVVFLVSLGLGLQRISTTQIANLDALQILDVSASKSKLVAVDELTLTKFSTLSDVTDVEPVLSTPTKVSFNGSEIDGVAYGKNLEYIKLENVKLLAGKKYEDNNSNEAMVNTAALTGFGVEDPYSIIGKEISLDIILKSDFLDKNEKPKLTKYKLKVAGVIDDKSAAYVYMPLELLTKNGVVNYSSAKVRVANKEGVDKVKSEVENLGFKATSIKETVDQINQFFSVFQLILISFGGIAIIVACLGMFNTLTITLLEKTREVGFMKALGTTRKDIYRLFIVESLLIGFMGSITGVSVGVFLGNSINLSILGLAKATGNQAVEVFYTPFYVIISIIFTAGVISFLTGLYPSRRAARINPLDALRYE